MKVEAGSEADGGAARPFEAPATAGSLTAERARAVELVIFDVDGVLTDAGVYVGASASGEAVELKRFDIQDGVGIKMLKTAGLEVAIVSGRVSAATRIRAEEIGIEECHQEPDAYKLRAVQSLLCRKALDWHQVAMLADDVPDLAVLRRVGLKAAVRNATAAVLGVADWISTRRGGHGAAREFCDALLEARGQLHDVIERYGEERSR